jgi:hypothetical protein
MKRFAHVRKSAGSANNLGKVVRIPFRNVEYFSTTASTNWSLGMFTLRPDYLGDVTTSISANYKLYRVVGLRVKVTPPTGGYSYTPADQTTSTYAASFTNIEPASAPGGFGTMSQMPTYVEGQGYKDFAFNVPRGQLLGGTPKWWNVKSEGTDTTDNVLIDQGWLYVGYYTDYAASAAMRIWVEFSGTIEFRDPEDQSISLTSPYGTRMMKESKFRTASALKYVFPDVPKLKPPSRDEENFPPLTPPPSSSATTPSRSASTRYATGPPAATMARQLTDTRADDPNCTWIRVYEPPSDDIRPRAPAALVGRGTSPLTGNDQS